MNDAAEREQTEGNPPKNPVSPREILRKVWRWLTGLLPAAFITKADSGKPEEVRLRDDLRILGAHVKVKREAMGLSQEDLAAKAMISLRTVKRLENGASIPCYRTLQRVATALHMCISIRSRT